MTFLSLQLRSHLTEVMLDQLPILVEMQRFLEHLSMMDPPAPARELILEQVNPPPTFLLAIETSCFD